jgi:anti-sigma factor RsiW
MSLCESIDTLAMAFLDDELAGEERHELELHLTECARCRAHLDGERADHELVRAALAAPPAPDLLRARVAHALDGEDRAVRRRWAQWVLPGSSMIAAAAAIAVFVGVRPVDRGIGSVAKDAVAQQTRALPLEVQGPVPGPWLRQHFEPSLVDVPQFTEGESFVLGARLLPHGINGHDAAMVSYQVDVAGNPAVLSALVVLDVRPDEMNDGDEVRVRDRTLHIVETQGRAFVTYVDPNHRGYMFFAPELSVDDLVRLVGHTDLVGP